MQTPRHVTVPDPTSDVARRRERLRQRRVLALAAGLAAPATWLWIGILTGDPVGFSLPEIDPLYLMSGLFFAVLLGTLVGTSVVAGRSPHVTFRPEQIDVRLADVKGLDPVAEEVARSLDLLRSAQTFRRDLGGRPRRGLLFEGPPGTGKTHLAKALAAEAGVPFLFVSATSFQSMYYGATARKIRSYFGALRKAARAEGAAIGFIEEIDAIALSRGGLRSSALRSDSVAGVQVSPSGPMSEGVGGVVNELLVQLQSFDTPTGWQRIVGWAVDTINLFLPQDKMLSRPKVEPVDVLLIAATNRADSLDPALLRPGRFDRRLVFSLPDKAGRRQLIDHFLSRKAHDAQLAGEERRDALAGITQGYSPAMLEHLLDEALVNAVRRKASAMSWADVEHARLVTEVGLGQPVAYTEHEQRLIATHEAGHAVVAALVAPQRRLEVLTIVKRADALGLLAHGDREDVYTRSRAELSGLIQIAMGGLVAEELFFGDVSTGPSGDLAYATGVAAQMVGSAGMADSLVSFAAITGGPFDSGLTGRVLADEKARSAVEDLLDRQKAVVSGLLAANRHLVEALRDALLERHELIGHEITDVLQQAVLSGGLSVRGLDGEAIQVVPVEN